MAPFFSIITCTKNSAQFLKENIDSVKHQTFLDYEHIFIDAFSTDGTKEIIIEYQKTNPRKIKFIQTEPKGIADAMNKGIKAAQGEYLIHLHSDDCFFDSTVLADGAQFLKKNNPDWTYSREKTINATGEEIYVFDLTTLSRKIPGDWLKKYLLKYFNYIRHQNVFIRKSVFDRFGYFDNSFPIAMDYEYWLRIRKKTKWLFFDATVSCFRMHDNGASSAPASGTIMRLDEMRAGRKYMNFFEFYVLRFLFKVFMIFLGRLKDQIRLYRSFAETKRK